jgi:hypothetical protein
VTITGGSRWGLSSTESVLRVAKVREAGAVRGNVEGFRMRDLLLALDGVGETLDALDCRGNNGSGGHDFVLRGRPIHVIRLPSPRDRNKVMVEGNCEVPLAVLSTALL